MTSLPSIAVRLSGHAASLFPIKLLLTSFACDLVLPMHPQPSFYISPAILTGEEARHSGNIRQGHVNIAVGDGLCRVGMRAKGKNEIRGFEVSKAVVALERQAFTIHCGA